MNDLLGAARAIAITAHTGQTDKAGRPYWWHPQDVAQIAMTYNYKAKTGLPDEVVGAVAWLHDVIEDTNVTAGDLQDAGMTSEIITAVRLLTRPKELRNPDAYYEQINSYPLARAVKLADIENNLDPDRLCLLDWGTANRLRAKYTHALDKLGVRFADDDRNLLSMATVFA